MKLHTYLEFFKAYILRKKTDLVTPRFHPVSDIVLPRGSMIHYMPRHENDDGPSVSETFISNYPDEVYIDFQFGFTPVLGKAHSITFNSTPVIKIYRNKHYNYKWLRDLSGIYRKEKKLIVLNHALAQRGNKYMPDRFINYYRAYNNLNMLVSRINENGINHPERQQFIRLDLPLNMPGYRDLLKDIHNLIKSFHDGKPVANTNFLTSTKAENCYWLMDLLLFFTGDYEHSLFGKLDKAVWNNLHFIFMSNSKLFIINIGLLMSWLEPLMQKEGDAIITASKRIYLSLINLSNNSSFKDTLDAKESDNRGVDSREEEAEGNGNQSEENVSSGQNQSGEDNTEADNHSDNNLASIFRRAEEAKRLEQSTSESAGSGHVQQGVPDVSERKGIRADEEDLTLNVDKSIIIDEEEGLDWLSPIDDSLLEPVAVSEAISVSKDVFSKPESGIELALEELAREGSLTVKQQEFYLNKAQSYKSIAMPNGQTMEDFIKISHEELHDVKGEIKGKFPTVTDKTMLRQRVLDLKVGYAKKIMHKHIAACVLNMQNAGYILTDYQLEQLEDIEGSYQNIKFQLMPVEGKAAIRNTRIPTIDDDGNYLVDGVKSYFQFQRMEKPIRKIAEDKVVLTSHYDKKVNINRSEFAADNYGSAFIKQILLKAKQKYLKVSIGSLVDRSVRCPRYFTMLSRKFKTITVLEGEHAGTELNFDTHHILEKHPDWKVYLKEDSWVIGEHKGKVLTIDEFGIIKLGGVTLDGIEELLGVDMKRLPIEYVVVNVNGYRFPAGVVLCYYFGIDKLLQILKTEYRTIPAGQRYKLEPGEYSLKFNDEQLVFDKRDRLSTLVFGGMTKLANLSNFSRVDLNKRNIWVPLMGDPKVRPNHFQEMRNMYDLFIDPITKKRLTDMGYSTDFHYLIIDAVKLLLNDHTRHEVEIEEQNIIGYERFVSHLYSEFCKSNRQFKTKAKTGNQTFDLNPEAVITNIITDASAGSVKEINPFHIAKSQEDYTFGGFKGRDEQTMLKKTRGQLKSYKGIISEANKDNGKVGFVGYLVSDPRIKNYLGEVDTKVESKGSQMLSSIGNLKYGTTLDDRSLKIELFI